VFDWERHIPFLEWTIIPYWSINVFYGLSFFACASRAELDIHIRRLLTAQVVAVACFILFPLTVTFPQPETQGLPAVLFDALRSFDQPFNQAPSLHIALLVILWPLYAKHVPRSLQWPLHSWFVLIGISVLTTYQHHFIDIPTGALLGLFCLWMWPERGRGPIAAAAFATDRRRLVIGLRYLVASALVAAIAFWTGGTGLWLLWPAVSLGLVAANYALIGPAGFQKDANGRMSLAARVLLAPYQAAAFVNSRAWTRRQPMPVPIADGVWLSRMPRAREAAQFASVVDLSAELPRAGSGGAWTCIPMLDLVTPSPAQLRDAAASIERGRFAGPVLVCCALGYSRSAASVATWLVTNHPSKTPVAAIEHVRRATPRVVIDDALRAAIASASKGGA
jgi:protein-tyrosine phosphatase/membrane-associated phospholipid phosphatase